MEESSKEDVVAGRVLLLDIELVESSLREHQHALRVQSDYSHDPVRVIKLIRDFGDLLSFNVHNSEVGVPSIHHELMAIIRFANISGLD